MNGRPTRTRQPTQKAQEVQDELVDQSAGARTGCRVQAHTNEYTRGSRRRSGWAAGERVIPRKTFRSTLSGSRFGEWANGAEYFQNGGRVSARRTQLYLLLRVLSLLEVLERHLVVRSRQTEPRCGEYE